MDELVEDMYYDWPWKDNVQTLLHILETSEADRFPQCGCSPVLLLESNAADCTRAESPSGRCCGAMLCPAIRDCEDSGADRFPQRGCSPVLLLEGNAADRTRAESPYGGRILEASLLYDQLNVTSLFPFEHLSRKFQLILAARDNDSLNSVYAGAEFYGGDDGDELLTPELSRKVLERMKAQAKVLEAQQMQKQLTVPLPQGPKGGQKGDKT